SPYCRKNCTSRPATPNKGGRSHRMDDREWTKYLQKMQQDWDERAKENARYYVATAQTNWSDDEFFRSGQMTVAGEVLGDMENICQGRDPRQMRVLEIGCGAGRITRALSEIFGEVHGVDVSGEMIKQAQVVLADRPNAQVYQNNGKDLSVLGDLMFD